MPAPCKKAGADGRGKPGSKAQKNASRVSKSSRSRAGDRELYIVESWRRVQAQFVDDPGGAVTQADQLLGDVMSTRGYPVSDFEQRRRISPWTIHWLWKITVPLMKSRSVKQVAKPARKNCARQ